MEGLNSRLREIGNHIISFWQSITSASDDQGAVEKNLQNSRLNPDLKTIENWLNRFDLPTILPRLEKSLEEVKRNKMSKESHEQLSKSLDMELQRLSLKFHPDRPGYPEWQSTLNAVRQVLKTLTVVFLENISIDYRYEYFSKLDIGILVNENEVNNIIQAMFYKISVLSETKRMKVVREIRKFLIESERCVECYIEGNKSDFEKYRNYALFHLKKNIEGYQKLEKEFSILIEECNKENDSMRTVMQNMASQSASKSSILESLQQVARRSFQGNFEIFPVKKTMDEYYILPFVDYVNVLSMCNLLLQPQNARFSSHAVPRNAEERLLFTRAYISASYICHFKSGNIEESEFVQINEHEKKLGKTLKEIFRVLKKDYRVEAYSEGKSNREEMYDKILDLKKFLGDIQEKEKTFGESVNRYKMERKESFVNYGRNTEKSFEVDARKQENESEEDSSIFYSLSEVGEIVEELYERQELSETRPTKE